MPEVVVILPSPLLPAIVYRSLADALAALGVAVAIADSSLEHGQLASDLIPRWAAQCESATALLAHSNAGYLAPVVRDHARHDQAIVFMDAALPAGSGRTPLAPPQFLAFLRELADESGRLPPWTRWWPRSEMAAVIPADSYDEVDRRCPRLPLSYFEQTVAVPDGWVNRLNAYLAFGDTYREEMAQARVQGWPHETLTGAHCHCMHDPHAVAEAVMDLFARLS